MQKDDCYWKVLRCDHHQSCDCEIGDDDSEESEYFADGCRESPGPMDRNFGVFLKEAQENPKPRKQRFRRRKRNEGKVVVDEEASDDSLLQDLKDIHGYYLDSSGSERLPQSADDHGAESDDEPYFQSLFPHQTGNAGKSKENWGKRR